MNQRGFTLAYILLIVGILIVAGVLILLGFNPLKQIAPQTLTPTPTPSAINEDYRGVQKDPNDPRYNLVKEKNNLTPEQLEILSRVAEGDR